MDCVFAVQGPDYILLAGDRASVSNSIIKLQDTDHKILKLANNQIKYLNSTLRIFKNLKYLEEITIKNNPFLSELFSYREYFISNYPNIKVFNEEIIDNGKRNFANNFYKENNPLYNKTTNRPMSSRLIRTKIQQNE